MKIKIILGFFVLTACFALPTFGSDCKELRSYAESAKNFLEGKYGNLGERALFNAHWVFFLQNQSPTGFRFSELPKEEQDAMVKFIEPIVFGWLEANPDTTSLTADECLFEALKEPLGLKELR
jgi:hypothetical protein